MTIKPITVAHNTKTMPDENPTAEEIREELLTQLRDADVFAAVAINYDPDAEDTEVTAGRAHSEWLENADSIDSDDVFALMQMLDSELDDLQLNAVTPNVQAVALSPDDMAQMDGLDGLLDAAFGGVPDPEEDDEELDDDSTSIDID